MVYVEFDIANTLKGTRRIREAAMVMKRANANLQVISPRNTFMEALLAAETAQLFLEIGEVEDRPHYFYIASQFQARLDSGHTSTVNIIKTQEEIQLARHLFTTGCTPGIQRS
jgi:hypothetical protein